MQLTVTEESSPKAAGDNGASQEQTFVLNELIIALMRKKRTKRPGRQGAAAEAAAMMPMAGEMEYDATDR
jgi:hypothetical protein